MVLFVLRRADARFPAFAEFKLSAEDKPPKRPPTSFMLFFVQYLKGLPATPVAPDEYRVHTKRAAEAWHSLTEQERKV